MNQLHTTPNHLEMLIYQTSRYYQVEHTTQPHQLAGSRGEKYNSINSQKKQMLESLS